MALRVFNADVRLLIQYHIVDLPKAATRGGFRPHLSQVKVKKKNKHINKQF